MKRTVCMVTSVLLVLAFLCACTQRETEPTWQTTLPNTGVTLSVAGGDVTESTTLLYPPVDGSAPPEEVCLLSVPAVATLTWEGVQAENVTVGFAYAWDEAYKDYRTSEPIEKVDYVPLDAEEGSLCYRFDTAYSFLITVTTEQGTDHFVLDCRRDI